MLIWLASAFAVTLEGDECLDYLTTPSNGEVVVPEGVCIQQILESWAAEFPETAQLVVLGESFQGRAILAMRVTDSPQDPESWARPSVFVTAGIHGNEVGAVRSGLESLRYILENPDVVAYPGAPSLGGNTVNDVLSRSQLVIAVTVNIDGFSGFEMVEDELNSGYRYFQHGIDDATTATTRTRRRWNARPVERGYGLVPNRDGVDLNRNFPFGWGLPGFKDEFFVSTTSSQPWQNNSGVSPLSEPEARSIFSSASWISPTYYLDVHGHLSSIDDTIVCASDSGKVVFNGEYNWKIATPFATFSFDPIDYFERIGTSRTVSLDANHLLMRNSPWALPALMTKRCSSPGCLPRVYSPLHPNLQCDLATASASMGSISEFDSIVGQAFGSSAGAGVGLRLEVLEYRHDPLDVGAYLATNDGELRKVWKEDVEHSTEAEARVIGTDPVVAIMRLMDQSANPIPSRIGSPAPRSRLTATALWASEAGCLQSQMFAAPGSRTNEHYVVPESTYGSKQLQCKATNWGNVSATAASIVLEVEDLSTGALSSTATPATNVLAGQSLTASLTFDFAEGHEYRVSCDPLQSNAADEAMLWVEQDPGCLADPSLPYCDGGDAVFRAVGREQHFIASIDPETVCRNGNPLTVNANGRFVAALPAVY